MCTLFDLGCARGDANMLLTVPEFSATALFTVLHNARFAASNTTNGLLSNVPNVVLPLGTSAQTKLPVTVYPYMSGRLATVELPDESLLDCLEGLPLGSSVYFPFYTKEDGKPAAVLDYTKPESLAWSYDIVVTKLNDDLYTAMRST